MVRMKTTPPSKNLVSVLAFGFFLALAVLPAHAATYTVINNADAGPGSLRQAILDANANAGPDIITFAPALNGQKILLTGGFLDVSDSVSILGPGPNQLAIDGNGSSGAFYLNSGQTNLIAGLTITNGHQGNKGGGIYNEEASLTVSNVALRGNSAGYAGGAIYNDRGTITLQTCTLSDNSAGGGGAGAIFNTGGSGLTATLTLQNCTLSGNSAASAGGAIYTVSRYGFVGESGNAMLSLQNCTLSGNSAHSGGGIYSFAFSSNVAAVTLQYCTFSGNSSSNSSSGSIDISEQPDGNATLTISHTLLAHGIGRNYRSSVGAGTVNNLGYNLSDDNNTTAFATTVPNLLLGPLANNGGPTLTHALLPFSPAINAGDPGFPGSPAYDQRGPGFPRVLLGRIDIGAFEATCLGANLTVVSTSDSGPGTLRQALNDVCAGGTITFAPALNGQIINLTGGQLTLTKSVSIIGPGPGQLTVRRSIAVLTPAFRLIAVNNGITVTVSGLTLNNGNSADGGGVRNDGTLTVSNCVVSGNTGTGNGGGGIANFGALTVTDCSLSNNTSTTAGGAIAQPSGGGTTLIRCTFSGNSAADGGALFNQSFYQISLPPIILPAYLHVTNCTFSGNTGTSGGSAAYNVALNGGATAQLLMMHCTVSGNTGNFALFNLASGSLFVGGSIVANNGNGPDTGAAGPPVISLGYNLVSRADGFATATGDRTGTVASPLDPSLGPLGNNGGPTLTHALLPSSPALNAGNPNTSGIPATDQRGPGFPRVQLGRIDMGAFEAECFGSITVVSTNDNGAGTLREALNDVCAGGTITFDPALNGQIITLTSGQLAVTKDVSIVGPGPGQLTVRRSSAGGTPAFRLLAVNNGVTATVSGLTLSNGNSADGGGVRNVGTLTVSNCVISGNSSSGNGGGGICNVGTLTVVDCTLSNNTSTAAGGAIAQPSGGGTTLDRCTFSGNTASDGGALFNQAFNQNGLPPLYLPALMNVTSCTFSGNSATGGGSAAYNVAINGPAPAQLVMQHCTVAGNPGGFALFNLAIGAPAPFYVGGSVVGNNWDGPDTGGSGALVISLGYNLVSRAEGFGAATGDRTGTVASPLDPLLGPLANNGGPTLTHLLLSGSPALDAGNTNTSGFPATDQRGPGFPRILNGRVDIGAVEAQPGPPPSVMINPVWSSISKTFQFSFTNVAGASFTVLASTNVALPLTNWTVLGTATESPGGHYQFIDTQATNAPLKFYHLRSP